MKLLNKKKLIYLLTFIVLSIMALSSGLVLLKNNQDLRSEAAKSNRHSGELVVVATDDFDRNRVTYSYYLNKTERGNVTESIKLNYTGRKILEPGSVQITGRPNRNNELTVRDSAIRYTDTNRNNQNAQRSGVIQATGSRRVAIVMLTWSNQNFTVFPTNAAAAETLFDQVENYFATESQQKLTLTNEVSDVYGWSNSGVAYNCAEFGNYSFNSTIGGAVTNAIPADKRSGYYSTIILVMPGCTASHADHGSGSGRVRITSDKFRPSVIEHEIGHNHGAYHTGDLIGCPRSGGVVSTACSLVEYGSWEPMGVAPFGNANSNSFAAYHKNEFGWLNSNQVTTINTDRSNININPLSVPTSTNQELRVCRDAFSYYSIENRTNTGSDSTMTSTSYSTNPHSGAVIRLVGTSTAGFPRNGWGRPIDIYNMGAYSPGQTMTDSTAGISIRVNSKSGNILNVNVDYASGTPATCPEGITPGTGGNPPPPPPPPPTTLNYCPDAPVTRDQMAVFLIRAGHGYPYTPPAVGGTTNFADVATNYWSASWIKQLVVEGFTGGCAVNPARYCPTRTLTRAEMAVFLLRLKYGVNYSPPAVGSSTGFADVATNYWASAWIKKLVQDGITAGCSNVNGVIKYCPERLITRAEMAVFLTKIKNVSINSTYAARFTDVPSGYWARAHIESIYNAGITGGCTTINNAGNPNYVIEVPKP